jgi:imidazole glycerol-phosphate synthase subunit HisF
MSKKIRIIARLDIKGSNVIKGIQLEGLRVVGKPEVLAPKYYLQGADEILYIDAVASLYERENLLDIVRTTAEKTFVPITAGGGIRSIDDIKNFLRAGADKVAINRAAIRNPQLIKESAQIFGSQCIVVSVEAKKRTQNYWEAYTDNGREKTGLSVLDWVKQAVNMGAGEILLTSVDKEGMKKGFDLELLRRVSSVVNVPIIISGGAGNIDHIKDVISGGPDAVAVASILHYGKYSISDIKQGLSEDGINVRLK